MASQPLHKHRLGAQWADPQIEQLIKELSERGELDAVDAIIWLRFELARARNGLSQRASKTR